MSEERRCNSHRGGSLQSLATYSSSQSVTQPSNSREADSSRSSTALVTILEQFVPPDILYTLVGLKWALQTIRVCAIQSNEKKNVNLTPIPFKIWAMFYLYASRTVASVEQLLPDRAPGALNHRYKTPPHFSALSAPEQNLQLTVNWMWSTTQLALWSPYLNPLDVCLWGRLQPLVYSEPIHNLGALQATSVRMTVRRLKMKLETCESTQFCKK